MSQLIAAEYDGRTHLVRAFYAFNEPPKYFLACDYEQIPLYDLIPSIHVPIDCPLCKRELRFV
jgi:hypothetical protein